MWRPDIHYAVNRLRIKPSVTDWRRGCKVISYLLGTAREGIMLNGLLDTIYIFTYAGEENLETGMRGRRRYNRALRAK